MEFKPWRLNWQKYRQSDQLKVETNKEGATILFLIFAEWHKHNSFKQKLILWERENDKNENGDYIGRRFFIAQKILF